MKPLTGRRILITRARHQASTLAAGLEERGAEVLAIPTIEILPPDSYQALDQALRNASLYQWLILTSVNGVAMLAQRLRFLFLTSEALRSLKIVAIGPATARALTTHGFQVAVIPEEYVAEAVVEALRKQVSGQNILLVRAKIARDVIPIELRKLGARVDIVDAYQTGIPAASCRALQETLAENHHLPDAITFTSSSTVANFFRLLDQTGFSALPATIAAVSIGPVTSRTLREHGIEPAAEAMEYTIPGLITALCRWSVGQIA